MFEYTDIMAHPHQSNKIACHNPDTKTANIGSGLPLLGNGIQKLINNKKEQVSGERAYPGINSCFNGSLFPC